MRVTMPNPSAAILKAASDLAEIVRASGVDLRPDGTDWIGRCPYHNDTEPSFHVYAGDDPHYHCFGCGSHGDVIDFVQKSEGLDFKAAVAKLAEGAGIEVENRQNGRPSRYQTVAIYEYTDRAGDLVYKIERRETENGDKRFVCKPKGVVRERGTLYRLPELVDGDDPVVVCEGEKCVDTLVELGITATCNPLGAGKWRDSYSETLRGRDVIVWPDNDEPGRKHANEVCACLRAVAASVRIVEPPDYLGVGGDVVDVLQAHDETEVRRQIESATLRKPEDTTGDQNASRPSICAGSADLAVTVDAAWEALEAYNKPTRLLRFGSTVVVLEEDETEIIVAPQSADALRVQLSRAARWFSVKNQNGERIEYVFGVLVRGTPPTVLTEAKDEDEWRKRITSTLLGAPEIIVIDNLRRRLDSAAFSAVLTARTWEDRRLGGSSNVSLPVRCGGLPPETILPCPARSLVDLCRSVSIQESIDRGSVPDSAILS